MVILALDPAQICGWAHSSGRYGVWSLKGTIDQQHAALEQFLEQAIREMGCELLASENAGFGSRNPQISAMHNERLGVIRLVAARHGIEVKTFQPAKPKVLATGRGNAKKPAMVAAAKRHLGVNHCTEDEADALWILELAKRPDCWESVKPSPKAKRKSEKRAKAKMGLLFK